MRQFQKILFFSILILTIFTFFYLFFPGPDPVYGGCKFGWNSWPGNPCRWDYASNCVECNPKI